MDVPVAQMTKGNRARVRKPGFDFRHSRFDEVSHGFDRHRNVVLHSRTDRTFSWRNFVSQQPECLGLGLVGSDDDVFCEAIFQCLGENHFSLIAQFCVTPGRGRQFDKGVPCMRSL